ncbi:MAG: bifunctional (p)ppGpp synthetase/guanosine-3',5'-bis(diphosphate) 3'-pyrophosphohydrolase [Wenzhouxiangella sp.]|nr:bifunctional (p)ppGpp synthetase/guanosine-3',5'-bis(diphosphate) 3'-pyrophosphohydrolase [Wenzhouxiangella sp.]
MDTQDKIQKWLRDYCQTAGVAVDETLLELAHTIGEGASDQTLDVIFKALKNLEPLSPDPATVAATLGFALPKDSPHFAHPALATIPSTHGLVEQLQRLDYFGQTYQSTNENHAEGLRRLLLALIEDVRVALIALAWQLARLQAARRLDDSKRKAIAEQTRLIHAPLANRLGIWQLKWALEDLSFQYLEPQTFQRIRRLVDEQREERQSNIQRFMDKLSSQIKDTDIDAEVSGRAKHLYSIWRKMQRKGLDFHELFDVRAVRVLVSTVAECYSVLGLVHTHWKPVPGEFDDYITNPKANLYQSLHTAVVGVSGRVIEVQIRTREMHHHAEFGVAAHWRYKEGGPRDATLENRIGVMRQLFESTEQSDQELIESFENLTSEDRVYVLTPTGEVKDLVAGATPLDFAYLIHTEVGHRCKGARINGRIVPLTTELNNGDRVEVLTAKEPNPSRDWMVPRLGYIKSARARAKVRQWFKQANHEENLIAGRHTLEAELKRLDLDPAGLPEVVSDFNFRSLDELYVAVGCGDLTASQVANAIERKIAKDKRPSLGVPTRSSAPEPSRSGDIRIEGVGQLMHQLARCCQPVPGDDIEGYITRGRGVSVHRADCKQFINLQRQDPDRVVSVFWQTKSSEKYPAKIIIDAWDRSGLIKDIGMVMSTENVNVTELKGMPTNSEEAVEIALAVQVSDFDQLSTVISRLLGIRGVLSARRVR